MGDDISLSSIRPGYFISDHCFVHCNLSLPRPNISEKDISFRSMKSMDMVSFQQNLSVSCAKLMDIDDPQQLACEYNAELRACLDNHAPIEHKTIVVRPKVPWFSDTLKQLKRSRRKMERLWRPGKSNEDRSAFKVARNAFVSQLHKAKVDYYTSEIQNAAGSQKRLFSIISSLACQPKENPLPAHTSVKALANEFGNFFKSKIDRIRQELVTVTLDPLPLSTSSPNGASMINFAVLSEDDVRKLILSSKSF